MKILSIAPGLVIASVAVVEAAAVALDFNTIIIGLIGLAGAWMSMKVAMLAQTAKDAKIVTEKTAETMKEIHVAVNSKETATAKKIEDLTELVKELSGTIKTLEENKRGAELAKAVASVPPVVVVPATLAPASVVSAATPPVSVATTVSPASAAPTGATSPLKEAISDLTAAAKDTVESADKTVQMVVKVAHT